MNSARVRLCHSEPADLFASDSGNMVASICIDNSLNFSADYCLDLTLSYYIRGTGEANESLRFFPINFYLRVAAVCVVALPVHARFLLALVLVVLTRRSHESRGAGAFVGVADRSANRTVPAGLRGAVVLLLAVLPCNKTECVFEFVFLNNK